MTKNVLKATILVFSLSLTTSVVAEEMFKWKDDKGVIHYTQTPPVDREYEIFEMTQSTSTGSNSNYTISASETSEAPINRVPNTDLERYNAVRKNNCETAKRNLNTLTTVARIRIPDGSGGERLLTDKEKSEKVVLSQKQVKNFCSKENDLSQTPQPATKN